MELEVPYEHRHRQHCKAQNASSKNMRQTKLKKKKESNPWLLCYYSESNHSWTQKCLVSSLYAPGAVVGAGSTMAGKT